MTFIARYAGTCVALNCPHNNRFHDGEYIEYVPNSDGQSLIHHECAEAERRELAKPLCGTCFTRHVPDRECY